MRAGGYVKWEKNAAGPAWLRGAFGEHFSVHVIKVTLQGGQVTDSTLEQIDEINQLEILDLWYTKIPDGEKEHLVGLRELAELHLHGPEVTDVELEKIAGLTQFETLWLVGTQVTNAGLGKFDGLSKLRMVCLDYGGGTTVIFEYSVDTSPPAFVPRSLSTS